MTNFDVYTAEDCTALFIFMMQFLTKDWHQEFLRERLTEIYDRELVDKLIPFQREDYFPFENMETISDEDLKKIGMFEEGISPYTIDNSLYHLRTKRDKMNITADMKQEKLPYDDVASGWDNIGSNCWAVHGNFTKSGKPMLACDPHLSKMVAGFWYPTRLSWNETETVDTDEGPQEISYRTYMAGQSNVGMPYFTYVKTPYLAGGITSMNPDVCDIFVEEVKDGKYLTSDGTWKDVSSYTEVIKVRFGSDVHHEIQYTENGVLLPKDLIKGGAKSLIFNIIPELWEQNDEIWENGKMYALAFTYDPLTHERLGYNELSDIENNSFKSIIRL